MSGLLETIVRKTHEGPIFGPGVAFGRALPERTDAMVMQAHDIAKGLQQELAPTLLQALPNLGDDARAQRAKDVLAKATGFVPILTNGELPQDLLPLLIKTALAVSCMYIADEGTDRGDEAMMLAIEDAYGDNPTITSELAEEVENRKQLLTAMRAAVQSFALMDDSAAVLECYDQLVLRHEARLHRLSNEYRTLTRDDERLDFLAEHAARIATYSVLDAGFQSVTSSLHTLYRHIDPSLAKIEAIHAHPQMAKLIKMCNTAARVADEHGDWWMDAGNDPDRGVFSINPFNQYHPSFITTLCELAYIEDPHVIEQLQTAFSKFHSDRNNAHGEYITDTFFNHVRDHLLDIRKQLPQYEVYIRLCMRVLEISHVNMMGDIRLAGAYQR